MKISTYILFFSIIGILGSSCTRNSPDEPKSDIQPVQKYSVPKITKPVQIVREFYTAINNKDCLKATKIRTGYTTEQCYKIDNVDVKELHPVSKSTNKVCLYIQYLQKGKRYDFRGHLTLNKENNKWLIAGSDAYKSLGFGEYKQKCLTDSIVKRNILPPKDFSNPCYQQNEMMLIVDVSEQKLHLCNKGVKMISYPVSTAKNGVGSRAGSNKTPLGFHQIARKIGYGVPKLTIFKARRNTGKKAILNAENAGDLVTSRIMWLEGLEDGKNRGTNVDSYKRYIYIHGTAEESLIGIPASHGCIRMINDDVIRLFEQVTEKIKVYIRE